MLKKKIVLVIVTHNGRHYLPDCLASLGRQTYPKSLVKIIVIDNNSSDSTVEYLKERHPEIKIIANRRNLGFAGANNQGYFLAQKSEADYLVLLNQDTIVEKNWLSRLVRLAETDSQIAMVQPKLLLYPEKQLINSLGNSIHFLGFAFCNFYRFKDQHGVTMPFEVPYASGAACLIRMSAIEKTGLFDSRLFMYHEDVDLGWRLRLAGYKILLDPLSVVYHKYHYSKAKYKFYYLERNRWLVILQNYRLATLFLFLPALLVMELGVVFFAFQNGWVKEKINGWFWLLLHWPSILSQRLRVQFGIRKVSDKEILKLFTSSVKFEEIRSPWLVYLVNPLKTVYFWLAKRIIFW
jgi:GT2 family glycosyltransferase